MSSELPVSAFAYALCQPGAERRLKQEIASLRPDYHPAFQRPGFVTFKTTAAPVRPDEAPAAMFARAWGCSAGPVKSSEDTRALADRLGIRRIWVGPRAPGGEVAGEWAALTTAGPARPGELVLDVMVAAGEPTCAGWHVHGRSRHVTPSGVFEYPVPADAPSRAYGKAVEGLAWSGAPYRAGEVVLEVGAAPGGTTLAFLERGLRVWAVDAEPMAAVVRAHPGFGGWLQGSIAEIEPASLPAAVHWLALDAGIAPAPAVRAVMRLRQRYRRTLRGMWLTLKLNDDAAVATVPRLLDDLRRDGATVDAIQLPTNRSDVFVSVRYRGRS